MKKSLNDLKNINYWKNPIRFSFWKKYKDIKRRCLNKKRGDYSYYGGRGICIEWKTFKSFYQDMFDSYQEHIKKYGMGRGTTLERINNDGNYCKENCRWATMDEQAKNRRGNIPIIYKGETKLIVDWCIDLNLKYPRTRWRISQGWPTEEAFFKPLQYKRKVVLKNNKIK